MELHPDPVTEAEVALAREGYDKFRDGDPSVFELWHPELEWHVPEMLPGGGDLNGTMEVFQFLGAMQERWEDAYPIPSEFIPADDRLIVLGIWQGRARSSGERFEVHFAHVQQFRDGKLIYFRNYVDSAVILRSHDADGPE